MLSEAPEHGLASICGFHPIHVLWLWSSHSHSEEWILYSLHVFLHLTTMRLLGCFQSPISWSGLGSEPLSFCLDLDPLPAPQCVSSYSLYPIVSGNFKDFWGRCWSTTIADPGRHPLTSYFPCPCMKSVSFNNLCLMPTSSRTGLSLEELPLRWGV